MSFSKKIIMLLASSLVLACAYSPHQITIQPQVAVSDDVYGRSRVVEVQAVDQRANSIIGSRGGAYPETSLIKPANDIAQAMVAAAKAGLRQQGFSVDSDQPTAATVKVIVDTLQYESDPDSLTPKVNLLAVLLLEVQVAEKTYSGRYKSATSQQLVLKPDAEKNEQLINEVLSQTLQRALSDPKVKEMLDNS